MPDNFRPISISRIPPKNFDGPVYKGLAPTSDILFEYKHATGKSKEYIENRYIERFNKEILGPIVSYETMMNYLADLAEIPKSGLPIWEDPYNHIVLLCFEPEGEFCHRNLVAQALREHGIPCREAKLEDFRSRKVAMEPISNAPSTPVQQQVSLDEIGRKMLSKQAQLAAEYSYKPLPMNVKARVRREYLMNMPECFRNLITESMGRTAFQKENTFLLYSKQNTPIAKAFSRIVIGDYGAFIEIDDQDMIKENIKIKPGEEYRVSNPKYAEKVKYQWFTAKDGSDCKLYFQQRGVSYADYKPGKWYISPYEVLSLEEIKERGFVFEPAYHKSVSSETKQDVQSNRPKKVVCFDTETTGFSPVFDDILQISIVGEDGPLLSTYLRPAKKSEWPQAMAVNNITPNMVKDAPKPASIAKTVQGLFDSADVIVGHNVPFDIRFVEANLGVTVDSSKVFDTLEYFKKDKPSGHHKLADAVDYYCPQAKAQYEKNAHDALTDTVATLEVYKAIMNKERNKHAEQPKDMDDTALEHDEV